MGVASIGKLPASTKSQVESVAGTAVALGLDDCSDTRWV